MSTGWQVPYLTLVLRREIWNRAKEVGQDGG